MVVIPKLPVCKINRTPVDCTPKRKSMAPVVWGSAEARSEMALYAFRGAVSIGRTRGRFPVAENGALSRGAVVTGVLVPHAGRIFPEPNQVDFRWASILNPANWMVVEVGLIDRSVCPAVIDPDKSR